MINNVAIIADITTLGYNQQSDLYNNDYIEIDESITNFEQLTQQQNFNLIRDQYKQSIIELSKLYYYFSRLKCQESVDYTIDTIYSTEKTLYPDLFYSYKQIRKYIVAIASYLNSCKENREENNHIAIICSKLADCFGFCLSGFNSKITDINDYINIYSNIEFRSKINLKIKKVLQEVIRYVLLQSQNNGGMIPSSNVHYQNAFFNLVAQNLNLATIVDKDANLHNVTPEIIENTINQIKNKLPKIIICKYITDYLYSIFKDHLLSIGKDAWQNNIISDLNMEDISYLENNFITPVNNYLRIKNETETLKIADIFIEKEIGYYELADIKDHLHYLLAKNINNIVKFSPNINNLIINIDSNTKIYNIYDCYFYVLFKESRKVLTLKHLLRSNLDDIPLDLSLSMFTQVLENSKEEDIGIFFNNLGCNKKSIINKHIEYISLVINNYIHENSTKKKIINAVTDSYIKEQKKLNFLLYNLIANNTLANSIIEELLKNKVNITSLLKLFNKENLHDFIISLSDDTTAKIISNYNHVNAVKKETHDIINEAITQEKNLALLEKIDSKLIDDYLISLNDIKSKQLLENIINDANKYRLARRLINDFIRLDIRDKNNNSILHKIVEHNDKKTLQKLIKNLDSATMHKLQFTKNSEQQIPLTYAITINRVHKDIITILLNNNKNIVNHQNKYGNTALLCSVINENIEYIKLILKYCDEKAIYIKNKINSDALMQASEKGYDNIVDILLTHIGKNYNHFFLTTNEYENNSLMLAIINKHETCAILHIKNYGSDILKHQNNETNNILMLATKFNMPNVVKKILTSYSHSDILKASEKSEYNSLMLSIRHNNQITKLFLENISCIDLNKTNNQNKNALNLAIEFNSDYLEQIIELSSVAQITSTFYDNGTWSALSQACYHGLDDKIITTLIEKTNNKILENDQGSVFPLLQAFKQGHLHCIKILHKYLTEENFINTKNKDKENCLVISMNNNYYDCAEYIVNNLTQDSIKKMLTKHYKNHRMKRIIDKIYYTPSS